MNPKASARTNRQRALFRVELQHLVNRHHPLDQLADQNERPQIETAYAPKNCAANGRTACPVRLKDGLHKLKQTNGHSDEETDAQRKEKPYQQNNCGSKILEQRMPNAPSTKSLAQHTRRQTTATANDERNGDRLERRAGRAGARTTPRQRKDIAEELPCPRGTNELQDGAGQTKLREGTEKQIVEARPRPAQLASAMAGRNQRCRSERQRSLKQAMNPEREATLVCAGWPERTSSSSRRRRALSKHKGRA
jgi:hypothetical protein